jgi:hypothetical protein
MSMAPRFDTIEDVAQQLGLHAEQLLLPKITCCCLSPKHCPPWSWLAVPSGAPHFVVVGTAWEPLYR